MHSIIVAYLLFNRSNPRVKDLKRLQAVFGRVILPKALHEIKWISKLDCVEVFAYAHRRIYEFMKEMHGRKITGNMVVVISFIEESE